MVDERVICMVHPQYRFAWVRMMSPRDARDGVRAAIRRSARRTTSALRVLAYAVFGWLP